MDQTLRPNKPQVPETDGGRRTVLIIQARMGSKRLPGKMLLDLAGAPLLGRLLERVKRVRGLAAIVVATTLNAQDDALVELASEAGVESFRGSEDDLVDRYYRGARAFDAEVVLRLPGDNPCSEPEAFERLIEAHLTGEADFSTNIMQVDGNGWPDGIGVEAFDVAALQVVWETARHPHQREHLASNFYDYLAQKAVDPARFRVASIPCLEAWRRPDLVLDVNTPEEYEFISGLYSGLYPRNHCFRITDIISWYDNVYRSDRERVER